MEDKNLRYVGGVVDLSQFREQKTEDQLRMEMLERIAAQVSPELYIMDDNNEEVKFEVLTSVVRPDVVLLMAGRFGQEEPIPLFLALPHDGETLSEQLRPMNEEEFEMFRTILNRSGASMAPLINQPVDSEDNPED